MGNTCDNFDGAAFVGGQLYQLLWCTCSSIITSVLVTICMMTVAAVPVSTNTLTVASCVRGCCCRRLGFCQLQQEQHT
jgi:hypothetical protein